MQQEQLIDGQKTSVSTFHFDRIYGGEVSNMEVYLDSCKNIVERVIQGYNGKESAGIFDSYRHDICIWVDNFWQDSYYDW